MGYQTIFRGSVEIEPSLNLPEVNYLNKFAETRRMDRERGPYFVDGSGFAGQGHDNDVRDYNHPDSSQPGLWCKWVPTEDGTGIEWSGAEKFYDAPEWMQYLIDHFLKPAAEAQRADDPQFANFTFDHVVNGEIEAEGEEPGDVWKLIVRDNKVTVARGRVIYEED